MNHNEVRPQPLIESVAGLIAGFASTIVAHPLDVVKTRLQVDRSMVSHFGSSFRIIQGIVRDEGSLTAFYRGLSPNIIGNSISWALYFLWYDKLKKGLQVYHGSIESLSYYDFFVASGAAGALTAVCTNPIWVVKTRMLSTSSSHPGAYSSILDGSRQIYQGEGLRGFYRGLAPSLLGVSHGALQFMIYEKLKIYQSKGQSGAPRHLDSFDFLLLSGVSKIFAGCVTYPYQVVRARLQMYDAETTYNSARDVVVKVWKKEGFKGFYKGLGPNLLRVLPSTWVTFLVYEKTKSHLPRMFGDAN